MRLIKLSALATVLMLMAAAPALSQNSDSPQSPQIHQAPPGARLFTVPVLQPGKPAWVSVYDQAGRPLPRISVLVNNSPIETDDLGQASFTVPLVPRLTLCLHGDNDRIVETNDYYATKGGLLTAEQETSDAVDTLEGCIETTEKAPMIAYAPAVVEASQPFVLIGKNLSGKPESDRIVLDGYDADVFAGSAVSLLATAPRRLSVGPLRELYVTAIGETSNMMEVDVCRIEFTIDKENDSKSEKAMVRVLGTSVPALIQLQNLASDAVTLNFQNKKLGNQFSFVTPGGENNCMYLGAVRTNNAKADVNTHLVSDAPWAQEDRRIFADTNFKKLVAELNRAEIIRLQRRLIAVVARINDEQKRRNESMANGGISVTEMDNLNAELRSLSNRQHRINSMICSRRTMFQALGGSDASYRQALEEANGGTTISLEKSLSPITSTALLAFSTQPAVESSIGNPTGMLSTAELQEQQKLLQNSMQALAQQWKKFPTKPARAGRLTAPPEPYIPNLAELFQPSQTNYAQCISMNPPPPPPLALEHLKQLKKRGAGSSHHKSAHHSSSSSKHHRHK